MSTGRWIYCAIVVPFEKSNDFYRIQVNKVKNDLILQTIWNVLWKVFFYHFLFASPKTEKYWFSFLNWHSHSIFRFSFWEHNIWNAKMSIYSICNYIIRLNGWIQLKQHDFFGSTSIWFSSFFFCMFFFKLYFTQNESQMRSVNHKIASNQLYEKINGFTGSSNKTFVL